MDTENLYPTKFFFLIPKFLEFSFALGASDMPAIVMEKLANATKKTRRRPQLRRLLSDQMQLEIERLDYRIATASSWKFTSLALSGFGYLRAGQSARRKCIKAAIEEVSAGTASTRTRHLAISGLLEARRFSEALVMINQEIASQGSDPQLKSYIQFLALVGATEDLSAFDKNPKINFDSPPLFERVNSRSVALVAPGVIQPEYGLEIDSHEVVARVKYLGPQFSQSTTKVGERCDVNFLVDQLVETAILDRKHDPKSHAYLNNVNLIISRKYKYVSEDLPPIGPLTTFAPTVLTTATSGTLAIFELLCQSPKKIKLFGFNFYAEREQYNSALLGLYDSKKFIKQNGLRKNEFKFLSVRYGASIIASTRTTHDYLSDFLFVKNLYELSGLIDGTPEVLEILNLTADEYDMRLEEMLGDW